MAEPGDKVYLGSILTNVHMWGIVSDLVTPSGMIATFEVLGNDGVITMDALVGPQGIPGENAPIVKMQYVSDVEVIGDLPDNLTESEEDIGKAWWIDNFIYLWTGVEYVQKQMGTAGPPGPTPRIHPNIILLDPDGTVDSYVNVGGTTIDPTLAFGLKVPRGPAGPSGPIRDAEDYDNSVGPHDGDVIAWSTALNKFHPTQDASPSPKLYSLPEGNFTAFTGFTTRQTIASIAIPPQPFDWVPYVTGHVRAVGVELDSDPLILGCEVRLGDPTAGVLVARGFGNLSTYANIIPHYSTPTSVSDAITPDNHLSRVVAAHTSTAGTLYVNLFNDGITGAYVFSTRGSQLAVMVMPVSEIYGGS